LAQVKNNLAPAQLSLAFTPFLQEGGPPTLQWQGTCSWAADQLLAGAARAKPLFSPRERACDFLVGLPADGPRTSREIWTAAEERPALPALVPL
jgi:hypothetical protein